MLHGKSSVQGTTQREDVSTSLLVLPCVAVPKLLFQELLLSLCLSVPGGKHEEPHPAMPYVGLQDLAFLWVLCDPGTHTKYFY